MLETLVVLPTYNERDNLRPIVERILASAPHTDILVVDDNSPDGTGDIADTLATEHSEVFVLHRTEKNGLGAAYLAGFAWGLHEGYWALVEMDADGSHHPEDLPRMIELLAEHDLVLGSRWVPGGRTENWGIGRTILSRGGSAYTRAALGIDVRDATGGFRVFSARALREINLSGVASSGYCFQIDLLWRALEHGLRVVEVPITFTDRVLGESKMSGSIVRESLIRVTGWGIRRRASVLGRAFRRQPGLPSVRAQYHRVLPGAGSR